MAVKQADLGDLYHPAPTLPSSWHGAALGFDKPQGWSSFDVIRKLRPLLQIKKIGHAGTLDPMATGLLICLVGRATKAMTRFLELEKTYTGTLKLGEVTPSYDAETPVTATAPWAQVALEDIQRARDGFLGPITQLTPMYAAVKVGGERLYKKARRGETVPRPPREVHVSSFDLVGVDGPYVSFEVTCSKGTYIRSLAHDLGQRLGCGAHLTALRRTAIGPFHVDGAWTLAALQQALRVGQRGGTHGV